MMTGSDGGVAVNRLDRMLLSLKLTLSSRQNANASNANPSILGLALRLIVEHGCGADVVIDISTSTTLLTVVHPTSFGEFVFFSFYLFQRYLLEKRQAYSVRAQQKPRPNFFINCKVANKHQTSKIDKIGGH